jgi:hypothetical protein
MDIINLVKELILHTIFFIIFLIFSTIMAFVILSLVIQDCLIFIIKKLGEVICQNKQ